MIWHGMGANPTFFRPSAADLPAAKPSVNGCPVMSSQSPPFFFSSQEALRGPGMAIAGAMDSRTDRPRGSGPVFQLASPPDADVLRETAGWVSRGCAADVLGLPPMLTMTSISRSLGGAMPVSSGSTSVDAARGWASDIAAVGCADLAVPTTTCCN